MSHWNPSPSGSERSSANPNADDTDPIPRVVERPEPADERADERTAWSGQHGWGYQPPPADPYEQPPIWAGPQPPKAPWEDQQPPKAFLRQQPQPPRGGGRGAMVVLALLVILAGGAAIVTVQLLAHGGKGAVAHRAGNSQAPPSGRTTPAGRAPARPTARPALRRSSVAVAPATARNPAARDVAIFLTEYFRAINAHDYPAYRRLLDARTRLVETAQKFSTGFSSTRDSGATLRTLALAPDGRLAATVTFTSHQLAADSPDQTVCTRWRITLYLERAGASYVIGPPAPGYQAFHQPC